jgi:hypothetical protein
MNTTAGDTLQKFSQKSPRRELTSEDQKMLEKKACAWFHKSREMNQKMMSKKELNFTVAEVQRLREKRANGAERLVHEYFLRQEVKRKAKRASTTARRPSISLSMPAEKGATQSISMPAEQEATRKASKQLRFEVEGEAEASDDGTISESESKQRAGTEFDVNPYVVKFRMGVSEVQSKMKAHNLKWLLSAGLNAHREDPLQERLNRRKMNAKGS